MVEIDCLDRLLKKYNTYKHIYVNVSYCEYKKHTVLKHYHSVA